MQMPTMIKTGFAFFLAISACAQLMAATPCESLIALKLPNTTITFAAVVAAGTFTPQSPFPSPGPRGGQTLVAAKDLPAFCRVAAITRHSMDSEIKFEVWMPASDWNDKFIGVGNGGMAGSISYPAMTAPLLRGYAA